MSGSNWTGRTPRNVQAAFGCYTSREVEPMPHKPSKWECIADALFATALGLIGAAALVAWIVR